MTISNWLNVGRPAPPGRGSAAGRKLIFWLRLTTASAQCLRLIFFHSVLLLRYIAALCEIIVISLLNFVYQRFCVWYGGPCMCQYVWFLFCCCIHFCFLFFYHIMVNQDEYICRQLAGRHTRSYSDLPICTRSSASNLFTPNKAIIEQNRCP